MADNLLEGVKDLIYLEIQINGRWEKQQKNILRSITEKLQSTNNKRIFKITGKNAICQLTTDFLAVTIKSKESKKIFRETILSYKCMPTK